MAGQRDTGLTRTETVHAVTPMRLLRTPLVSVAFHLKTEYNTGSELTNRILKLGDRAPDPSAGFQPRGVRLTAVTTAICEL